MSSKTPLKIWFALSILIVVGISAIIFFIESTVIETSVPFVIDRPWIPKEEIQVMVIFNHPYSENVKIYHTFNGKPALDKMEKESDYVFTFTTSSKKGEFVFNILTTIETDHKREIWTGTDKGIDAAYLAINNIELDEKFLTKFEKSNDVAFTFKFIEKNKISVTKKNNMNVDKRIPSEIVSAKKIVRHELPPEGFNYAIAWMQAIYNGDEKEEEFSRVDFDYLKLYSVNEDGQEKLLNGNEYYYLTSSTFIFDHGKLYLRHPFFFEEESRNSPMEISTDGMGFFTFYPHEEKDKVWHWWGSRRAQVPEDSTHLKVEARAKITGAAVLQTGIDFWRGDDIPYSGFNINNTEAGISDLYFASPDWQIITFSTKKNN